MVLYNTNLESSQLNHDRNKNIFSTEHRTTPCHTPSGPRSGVLSPHLWVSAPVHRRTESKAPRQLTVFFCSYSGSLRPPRLTPGTPERNVSVSLSVSVSVSVSGEQRGWPPRPARSSDTAGSLELNSGEPPDEYPVLVSKVKHRFFSEENLYGLWNLEIILKSTIISGHIHFRP